MPTLSAVLLAAGLSRRYGSNKLLAQVEGRPLYRRAFDALPAELFTPAVVVSGYNEILKVAAKSRYIPLENSIPEAGQSLSVRLGLEAVAGVADAVLFAVCDQPWLTRGSVERLIAAWRAHPGAICALGCGGERGNPVIFPRRYFPELARLSGDVGGGAVIRAHPEALLLVETPARELQDLDRPLS